ncbi:MAG: hypothetical protein ACREMV_08295 [Gemmatimonadales bacterium]
MRLLAKHPGDIHPEQNKRILVLEVTGRSCDGDWAGDIAAYDEVHQHILQMADVLSDGIIKQFASRFN